MQDIEFTVQRGKLWMLQTRNGKRTAKAALKIAVDMAREGLITASEAVLTRIDPASLDQLLHPTHRSEGPRDVIGKSGLPASPGAATGKIVFTADEAEREASEGARSSWCASKPARKTFTACMRREGHPDRARRHDQPRRGGGARHGPALRLRRRDRCASTARPARCAPWGDGGEEGRHHHHRRLHRRGAGKGAVPMLQPELSAISAR
jgi:hypothetical protein